MYVHVKLQEISHKQPLDTLIEHTVSMVTFIYTVHILTELAISDSAMTTK